MRTPVLMLAIATGLVAPMTLAQSRNPTPTEPPAAVANPAQAQPSGAAPSARKPHGAFGRAMADLTRALRDASLQQAQATQAGTAARDQHVPVDATEALADDRQKAVPQQP